MDRETQNRIGYLPEERGLYRKMKVIDHLYFLAAIKEVSRDERARRASPTGSTRWSCVPGCNKKVDELSKGMQQKVQFIATIVHDPEILILDEPFSGLDPINAALMKDYFLEFRARGKTIVFSTHVLEQAEKLCDEIVPDGALEEDPRGHPQGAQAPLRRRTSCGSRSTPRLAEVARAARRGLGRRPSTATYVVALTPGHGPAGVPARALDRYDVDGVLAEGAGARGDLPRRRARTPGIEETRTIE